MTRTISWRRVGRHALVWALVLGGHLALYYALPGTRKSSAGRWVLPLVLLAGPVYAHQWLLTHLLEGRRPGRYVAATLALVAACALLFTALNASVRLKLSQSTDPADAYSLGKLGDTAVSILLTLLIASVTRYVWRGLVGYFQMQALRTLQVQTELNLLKAQVNQHFLFNTLNNLYGLSLTAPAQMPEALLQLAGLMRYQLDSSRQIATTVGTEAEYLANYIGLEKLRLRANTTVEFSTDLPHPDQPLAPLLLLPLVENCFKHAVGPSGPNFIRLHLSQTADSLTLRTDNSIPPHFRPAPSGLGLPTLQKRLAQFYPGPRHSFAVQATADRYRVTLVLVL